MKLTKAEKIWLAAVVIFYVCYNLPFVPAYGHSKATLIHALITLVPLWISIYVGLAKVCKIYQLKKVSASDLSDSSEASDIAESKEDTSC